MTTYIGPDAVVSGNADVSDDAVVYDNACVTADARVGDNAHVSGNAVVSGNAYVYGNARVYDNARVGGNARVYDNARVSGNAYVSGNAHVSGNAVVSGNAHVGYDEDLLIVGPASSSGRYTTAHKDSVIGVRVNCGCFSGSVEQFELAIMETHKENEKFRKEYLGYVALIKCKFDL